MCKKCVQFRSSSSDLLIFPKVNINIGIIIISVVVVVIVFVIIVSGRHALSVEMASLQQRMDKLTTETYVLMQCIVSTIAHVPCLLFLKILTIGLVDSSFSERLRLRIICYLFCYIFIFTHTSIQFC